jgi:hypothetical protein
MIEVQPWMRADDKRFDDCGARAYMYAQQLRRLQYGPTTRHVSLQHDRLASLLLRWRSLHSGCGPQAVRSRRRDAVLSHCCVRDHAKQRGSPRL